MANLDEEQAETEVLQSPDVDSLLGSIDETTEIQQSQSKSLIQSLLVLQQTEETQDERQQKKKKIKTDRQRELERLTKATKAIFTSPEQLNVVCERINSLLSSHKRRLLPVCHSLDQLNSGRLSYEQFRLILRDQVPQMSSEDFFLLTKLFENNGLVDYRAIFDEKSSNGILQFITSLSVLESNEIIADKKSSQDPTQLFDHPKYVTVHLRLITFDSYNAYPGHIHLTVPVQISIYALSKMIIDQTDLATRSVSIYREKVPSRKTLLDPMLSLERYGYTGAYVDGTHNQSFPTYTLYYDYSPMNTYVDCPILQCDYYMK